MTASLEEKLRAVRALLLDVDGVLTDGSITYTSSGEETKVFDVKDGYGITAAIARGLRVGIITGRSSEIVIRRATELGITDVYQGILDKRAALEDFKVRYQLNDCDIAYMGDDVLDLVVLKQVGFSAAPKNAHASVKIAVDLITQEKGGRGAVREVIDLILTSQENQRR